ncbi:MAG: hypothetical protein AAF847_03140 [Bacteroidota bacterium]
MLRFLLIFAALSITLTPLQAQKKNKYLSGHWKGYITQGSLEATVGLPFELYLEARGSKVKGRTYIHQEDGEIIEMEVSGVIYSDHSIYLEEGKFVATAGFETTPDHTKKYQFVHTRSIFDSENTLDGYWQEIIETPLALKRKRGKIFMRKVVEKKA